MMVDNSLLYRTGELNGWETLKLEELAQIKKLACL
jgi:hypothetical protein